MYEKLAIFQTAAQMAKHAGARQALTARNIANADTPNFRATHLPKFQDAVGITQGTEMRATRVGHTNGDPSHSSSHLMATRSEASPNGNTVSLEEEMMYSVEIAREHSRALTVYKHAMNVIRSSIGR